MAKSFKTAGKLIIGLNGIKDLPSELDRLCVKNPVILTDEVIFNTGLIDEINALIDLDYDDIYTAISPEPEYVVVEKCTQFVEEHDYDGIIAIGGGSVIDTAKAVSAFTGYKGELEELVGVDLVPQKGVPLIAIPTTSGTGSEVTNISILSDTKAQLKKGIVSDHLLPDLAIIAPEMTKTMPPSVTASSGIDALVHAVEAYISVNSSTFTDTLALKAIQLISDNLPKAYANPNNLVAREGMATGSLFAGMAFGNAGVGAVHALAYPLGGRYSIPHGVSNALLLPYVMEWNKIACLERLQDIAIALGENVNGLSVYESADIAVQSMERLCRIVNIPKGLSHFGIPREEIADMAADAIKVTRLLQNNPRQLSEKDIVAIYQSAY